MMARTSRRPVKGKSLYARAAERVWWRLKRAQQKDQKREGQAK
jgi:hypothetical protein